jgi:DNA-binding transcriptional LysR family regulator
MTLPRTMTVQSNEAIKYAVIANMGISILSAYTLFDTKELTQLNVADFPIMAQWQVTHLKDKRLSIVAEKFLRFMLDNGEELLPMERIKMNIKAAKESDWPS